MTQGREQGDGNDRDKLARSLRALRTNAGLNQTALAEQAGLSQPQVSRAETDRRLLSPEDVARIAEACGASRDERLRLVGLAKTAAREFMDVRAILQRGTQHFQERIKRYEADSTLVRAYQPGLVLGPLQTPDYARAVFEVSGTQDHEELDRLVVQRSERSGMLRDPVRRWELVQTEGALSWCLRDPAIMGSQLDHLVEISYLPNVTLGVIPEFTPMSVLAPHGFHIYDADAVQIGTLTATALLSNRDDVTAYVKLLDKLLGLAVFGDEARELLTRIASHYREIGA